MKQRPFDIDVAVRRIREAVRPFADAAMFALADAGWRSVFHQLVACVLSIRTKDEVSLPAALRLFAAAPTPAALARMDVAAIDALIADCTFHEPKAAQVREIARRTVADHGGELPCDAELLTSFHGVGPKCAHLALGIACGAEVISVDVHVHRVANRWGIVQEPTPERTMRALERVLPRRYWVEINRLLVPFGKHVCTGVRPRCSACALLDMCAQVGVTTHR
ncbi:MAG TPA: endonuclease III [Gemmatimonadaceae bacterium]|nr:endonuclease III [Gemmatimonadaceae bacterium]